ncbi:hypothetical protein M2451_001396 [Dysgonomonas sp. PFB1-18]|nr:hypothetical protein [Dysgonomonas sp. PF1-14]MDH6338474.1 hypothetical protein [Dysgonomonas sp. PF1-16]MDH6380079.1 hypothetical protein [Dysgonomonas sp. PFB1-18]MDH6397302.1 hypothetical protein [Dysgonomonas sp. PF1-23]
MFKSLRLSDTKLINKKENSLFITSYYISIKSISHTLSLIISDIIR